MFGMTTEEFNYPDLKLILKHHAWDSRGKYCVKHKLLSTLEKECLQGLKKLALHVQYHWAHSIITLGARHNTAREVLWKYADSIPNIVNIL